MMRRLVPMLLLAVALACGACRDAADDAPFGAAIGAPLVLRAEVSTREAALFDPVDVVYDLAESRDVIAAAPDTPRFEPPVPDGFVGEELSRTVREADDHRWTRVVQRLRPSRLGTIEIPSVVVERGDARASTDPIGVTVVGRLGTDLPEGVDATTIEEPGPAFDAPSKWPWWIAVGGGVAAFAALAWWLLRSRGRARDHAEQVAVPAHVEALRALARLRNAPRATDAEVDAFYVAVSDVLRRYLERRFGLHAPERTTEEFLPEVASSGRLDTEQQRPLSDFLRRCALVKFARHRPSDDEHVRAFEFAESLVHATREDLPEQRAADRVARDGAEEVA